MNKETYGVISLCSISQLWENFYTSTEKKVPELKKYLRARGISVSNKKKEELLELTEKAHELGLELTDNGESISDVVNAKLVTKDGTISNPFNPYSDWSTDFSDAPNFAWGDLYCHLINKKGYIWPRIPERVQVSWGVSLTLGWTRVQSTKKQEHLV